MLQKSLLHIHIHIHYRLCVISYCCWRGLPVRASPGCLTMQNKCVTKRLSRGSAWLMCALTHQCKSHKYPPGALFCCCHPRRPKVLETSQLPPLTHYSKILSAYRQIYAKKNQLPGTASFNVHECMMLIVLIHIRSVPIDFPCVKAVSNWPVCSIGFSQACWCNDYRQQQSRSHTSVTKNKSKHKTVGLTCI